ncbi:hypothetical protein O6H91_15G047300 [Diphasiastrum complanatum]|uniref:Uncharacterized protein n=1 Tax=Diphasiastrum complanatum TaxID=34168 RepID=A0ACC2BJ12_DIPCM|nr:hypothetical protein O6H91_15G047300 [Diphasiastrum complanatum]
MVGVGRMGSEDRGGAESGGGAEWTENGGIGGHFACVAGGTLALADSEPSASVGNGQLARVGDEPSATVSGEPSARENRGGEVSEVASEGEHPSVRGGQPARVEQSQSSSREARGAVARGTVASRAGGEAVRGSGESARGGFGVALAARVGEREDLRGAMKRSRCQVVDKW